MKSRTRSLVGTFVVILCTSWQPPILADDHAFSRMRIQIEGRVAFVEGPAWHPSDNVYFQRPDHTDKLLEKPPLLCRGLTTAALLQPQVFPRILETHNLVMNESNELA